MPQMQILFHLQMTNSYALVLCAVAYIGGSTKSPDVAEHARPEEVSQYAARCSLHAEMTGSSRVMSASYT